MVKVLKISEYSIDRLKAYAENYKLVVPQGLSAEDIKKFYVDELTRLNDGMDDVGASIDATKYKGVSSCMCSICGEEKAVRPDVYAKRVIKYGNEEELRKNYKCLNCRGD